MKAIVAFIATLFAIAFKFRISWGKSPRTILVDHAPLPRAKSLKQQLLSWSGGGATCACVGYHSHP